MSKAELQNLVTDYAYGAGIDPQIALAQAQKESGFLPDVVYGPRVSSTGARGLMQFMPGTWSDYGQGSFDNAFDPDYNLTAWAAYMTALLNRYNWDYRKALMAYYGGPGRVDGGNPSQDIQNYADSILNNAGAYSVADGSGGAIETDQASLGITPVLIVAVAVVGAALIFRK